MRKVRLVLILTAVAGVALAASFIATNARAASSGQKATFGPGLCGQLTSNPDAAKAMLSFRSEALKDMQTWWDKYSSDPTSTAAQQALQNLRGQRWNDMQQLLKKYGIAVPTTAPSPGVTPRTGYGPGMMGGFGRMMEAGSSS